MKMFDKMPLKADHGKKKQLIIESIFESALEPY